MEVSGVPEAEESALPAQLFIFRAPTPAGVLDLVAEAEGRLGSDGRAEMHKLARELLERCPPEGATLSVVARDVDALRSSLKKARNVLSDGAPEEYASAQGIYYGEKPLGSDEKVAFLFPGQGSQYLNMGGDILSSFPFLRNTFLEVDRVAQRWTGRSVLATVFVEEGLAEEERNALVEEMVRTDYNHPALLAMWAGITAFLRRAGIRPHMAAGHSVGEYGALYVASVFDLESVVAVTTARGTKVYEHAFRAGAMAAIGAPAEQVEQAFAGTRGLVTVANKNCPAQTVISGETEAVKSVMAHFEKLGVRSTMIPTASGFHSPLMSSCVEPFRQVMESVYLQAPSMPVECNLTGRPYGGDGDFGRRMRDALAQHLVRPVEFVSNVESMYALGARLFLEVGPGSTLCSFVDNVLGERRHWTFPTNLSRVSAATQLLHTLGFCAARGLKVDLAAVLPSRRPRLAVSSVGRRKRMRAASVARSRPAQAAPDLMRQALAGVDTDAVERYMRERKGFLEDLVRLDFEHFAGERPPGAPQAPVAGEDDMEKMVVDLVSRRIGYPPEVLGLDLDVEAELGLDSIKQAEIVRELETTLGVSLRENPQASDLRITTLRDVAMRFRELVGTRTPGVEAPAVAELQAQAEARADWNLNCHRFTCELREKALPPQDAAADLTDCSILLLADAGGVALEAASRLEKAGATVSVVPLNDADAGLPDKLDIVLDMWSYGEDDAPAVSQCEEWWQRLESRAVALLKAAKKFVGYARSVDGGRRPLWVEVTSLGGELAAHAVEPVPSMAGAGLGMSRCLFADHPELVNVLYLDFDAGAGAGYVADRMVAELTHTRPHNEIGYVKGKRSEIHWAMEDRRPDDDQPPLEPQSVVLAIGGARGITASICRELAHRTKAHFVLVGRSALREEAGDASGAPVTLESARRELLKEHAAKGKEVVPAELERLAWQRVWSEERARTMRTLRGLAQSVTYRQCDLTDGRATEELIRDVSREHGRIDLVINGVGALVERTIEEFEPEAFVAGFRSKALGTANLLAALRDVQPRTFVNLSSVVGRWGYIGLASYAVGHVTASILVAGMRGRGQGRWLNPLYGPWLQVGMTRQGSTIERLSDSGGAFVGEREGSDYFVAELQGDSEATTAFRGCEPFGVMRGAVGEAGRHPLLDYVSIVAPGVAEGRRVLDPSRDSFISEHHVLVEPIMPGTVAMEMMAQTALLLVPDQLVLTEVQDLDLVRMVRFPRGEPREFHTRARLVSQEEDSVWFSTEFFSMFRPPEGGGLEEVLHGRCKLRFGVRQEPPEPVQLVVQTGLGDCIVDMSPFWSTRIALGRKGMFRSVHSITSMTDDTVSGQVIVTGGGGRLGTPTTENPIRTDGLLYIGTLPDVILAGHASHYVRGVKSITFFGSDELNEARFCRGVIASRGDGEFVTHIEAVGSIGRVLERVREVVNVSALPGPAERYDEPIVDAFRWNPQRVEIAGLLGLRSPLSLAEVRVSLVGDALKAEGEESFLAQWASGEERAQLASMRHDKRRREWLAGRVAAKEAVRSLLGSDAPAASAIRVLSSPDQAPYVAIGEGTTGAEVPHISIAHSQDSAVAAAMQGARVGIDVEMGTLKVERVAHQFSRPQEVNQVSECVGELRVPALMTLWVVKEAALKAVGPDRCAMMDLVVDKAWLDGRYTVCELYNENAGRVRAVAFRSFHYFYAVAAPLAADATDGGTASEA